MWPHVLPARMRRDDRDLFVIAAHHPDRLRRPAASPGAVLEERVEQALAWNIFRTLELVSPSFWLRRLHIRLTGEPSVVPPQIVRVALWQKLPLPPIQRIDGDRPDVVADVVIETEHAVWTLVMESTTKGLADGDLAASLVDAGAWFAGARQHYCGLIASSTRRGSVGSILRRRYARSRDSALLRSATRGPAAPIDAQWGAIGWPELAALLLDCDMAATLPPIERALARNALEWLTRAGVDPATDDGPARRISG